jgi:hypothetical protein
LPDADGRIGFTLAEIEANKNSHLTIENLSNEEITVKFSISSDPGSYSNPFDITHGDDDVIANVANGGVNYKYVASADGVVTIMTTQMLMFKTSIMAEAKPLVRVSGESDGYFGVWQLDIGDVIYTLTVSEDSILIEDNDESSASIRGTYTYTVSEDGEFALVSKDDATKALDVTLFEGGNTIVATRSSDSSQIVIDGNVKSKTISVTAGDEIRILVNSEFSDEVSFKLLFEESEA